MDTDISLNVSTSDSYSDKKKKREKPREVEDQPQLKRKKPDSDNRTKKRPQHGGKIISSLFAGNPYNPELPKFKKTKNENKALFSDITFSNAGLHPHMTSNLEKILGSSQMTEVQRIAIPVLISGKDALVRSHTGSGKTLAYAVPIIQALQEVRPKIERSQGTFALIVVPTRELALQTYEWLVKLTKSFTWLVPGVLSGGEKKKSEKARMRKGVTILVSTPGRLIDHLQHTQVLSLSGVKYFVLDEADRMLDMGYERDVASIVSALNEQGATLDKRQTILLSATLTPGVERLAGLVLRDARAFLDADTGLENSDCIPDEHMNVPESLEQWVLLIPAKLKLVALAAFVAAKCELTQERKMLIFCATQDMVDYLTPLLSSCLAPSEDDDDEDAEDGISEEALEERRTKVSTSTRFFRLHGNMTQKDRMEVFKTFRDSSSGVLLCTDVASRGLDLPQVDWIVQYTAPPTIQDYVHRVGRTARVGNKGSAVIFLAPSESEYINKLNEGNIGVQEMNAEKVLDYLLALIPQVEVKRQKGKRKYWRPTVEGVATALQLKFEMAVLKDRALHDLACKAYTSFVRFYASYPKDSTACFHYKALHLGHYAKSFALRDPPSAIGGIGKRSWEKDRQWQEQRNAKKYQKKIGPTPDRTKELINSEFASGF